MYLPKGWKEFKKFAGRSDEDSARTHGLIKNATLPFEVEDAYLVATAIAQIDNEIDAKPKAKEPAVLAICREYGCPECALRKIKKPDECAVLSATKESVVRAMGRYKKLYERVPLEYCAES